MDSSNNFTSPRTQRAVSRLSIFFNSPTKTNEDGVPLIQKEVTPVVHPRAFAEEISNDDSASVASVSSEFSNKKDKKNKKKDKKKKKSGNIAVTDEFNQENFKNLQDIVKNLNKNYTDLLLKYSALQESIETKNMVASAHSFTPNQTDRRLFNAVSDKSLAMFDGITVRNSANWIERFVDVVNLHDLDNNLALELFKHKLTDKAQEAFANNANVLIKTDLNAAIRWMDETYIATEHALKQLSVITSDRWRWEDESFDEFLSRFTAHFGSYNSKESDKINYLLQALPSKVVDQIRSTIVPLANDYKSLSILLSGANLDAIRPTKVKTTTLTSTPVPVNVTQEESRVSENINDNEIKSTADVNFITNRGGSNFKFNYRGRGRGSPNPRGNFPRRGNPNGSYNSRQFTNRRQNYNANFNDRNPQPSNFYSNRQNFNQQNSNFNPNNTNNNPYFNTPFPGYVPNPYPLNYASFAPFVPFPNTNGNPFIQPPSHNQRSENSK